MGVDLPNQFIIGGTYNLSNGALRIGDVVNDGTINYSGGSFSLNVFNEVFPVYATLLNNNIVNLSGSDTRTIEGKIINNGTFKTTQTTAVYTVTFTNNGAYISDPATQYFNDLIVGQSGYLVGQHADKFFVSGDFISSSIMNMDWNTKHAYLEFIDGADNLHDFYLTGRDYGATMSAYANNFSWGTLDITDDYFTTLHDGNTEAGPPFTCVSYGERR